jgi:hypothetical protein
MKTWSSNLTEVNKHPTKAKSFSRLILMDMAKVIRNCNISENNRILIGRDLATYFQTKDPFFDRKTFMQIVSGQLNFDTKTEAYSTYEGKQNDT